MPLPKPNISIATMKIKYEVDGTKCGITNNKIEENWIKTETKYAFKGPPGDNRR